MGRPATDLSGQKFGRLLAVERDLTYPSGAGKSAYWRCQCDCGNFVSIRSDKLKKGITQSCGCLSKEIHSQISLKDLSNQKFGRLLVIERDTSKPMGKECFAYWKCQCDCGNLVSVRGDHLRNGTTQSCGCLNSTGEEKITNILQKNNVNYKTQYTFPDLTGKNNSLLRFDFALLNNKNVPFCLIEYQGQQHYKPWGNEPIERFQLRQEYDVKKEKYCNKNGIPLVIIKFSDFEKLDWEYLKNEIYSITRGMRRKTSIIEDYADIGDIDFTTPQWLKGMIEE